MSAPGQGGNGEAGQYYDWNNQGPDMSKYAAPAQSNLPPPYGFSSANQQPAQYPPPQQGVYPPQQGTQAYPPQNGVTLPAANVRTRTTLKHILWLRLIGGVIGIIAGSVIGYYAYNLYH